MIKLRSKHSLYQTWTGMWYRCTVPTHGLYRNYGARGISVCERWRSFDNFVGDMGTRPPQTTLDRIDNDGNYEPDNCRWATAKTQCITRRRTNMQPRKPKPNRVWLGKSAGWWARRLGCSRIKIVRMMRDKELPSSLPEGCINT